MTQPCNLFPSYSRFDSIELVDEGVTLNNDAFYDMSGAKRLIILNQKTFKKTKHFKKKLSTREGTEYDERRLKEVFHEFGFKIDVFTDLKYQYIIDIFTEIATLDHTRTSCIFVAILTHGHKGGQIHAADKPYQLTELIAIFDKEKSLVNKPKVFLVQACRGGKTDAGHTVSLGSQSFLSLRTSEIPYSEEFSSRQAGSYFLNIFRNIFMGAGSTDRADRQNVSALTVPTHADRLVLRSTVEGYVSYRHPQNGTWMIQTLCHVIQNHHEDEDLLGMITLTNRLVAKKITSSNKKQILDSEFTLTKKLKFEAVPR